eukprot:Phypoly_transcript_15302.p1 GENE.Phypoly_transcript_15302~~Phypoly_transcript_15302.p1  ORF type:complete len:128 (+),score=23.56 Phypoly_transcript_15302:390-773(+)
MNKPKLLERIVFVGSSPMPEKALEYCSVKFTGNTNIIIPPNKETLIWEGASRFALTTYGNPDFHTNKFLEAMRVSADGSDFKRVKTGVWMDKAAYIERNSHLKKEKGMQAYLEAATENYPQHKCNIS